MYIFQYSNQDLSKYGGKTCPKLNYAFESIVCTVEIYTLQYKLFGERTLRSNMVKCFLQVCIYKQHSGHATKACYNKRYNPHLKLFAVISTMAHGVRQQTCTYRIHYINFFLIRLYLQNIVFFIFISMIFFKKKKEKTSIVNLLKSGTIPLKHEVSKGGYKTNTIHQKCSD